MTGFYRGQVRLTKFIDKIQSLLWETPYVELTNKILRLLYVTHLEMYILIDYIYIFFLRVFFMQIISFRNSLTFVKCVIYYIYLHILHILA